MNNSENGLHKVVVVGGGAAGLELATRLGRKLGARKKAHITLVDTRMTHIWKPLLHEVAAGSLNSYSDELNYVAQANWNHFHFQPGRMIQLDRQQQVITLAATVDANGKQLLPERTLTYDTLVIAVGSHSNDFGTPGVHEHCLTLDCREQAEQVHTRFISEYLRAQAADDPDEKMNIAIVGAGATGVELAAELHYAAKVMARYGMDAIKPENVNISIIEGSDRVLPVLPLRISNGVQKQLDKLKIQTLTGHIVKEVTEDGLTTNQGEFVKAELKIWAAGIKAPSFLSKLDGLESNRINQLIVKPTLQTTLDDNIFVIGDCASCTLVNRQGENYTVPPRAQAAHQQASLVARSIIGKLKGKAPGTFSYKDHGSLISLSTHTAVGNLMGNLTGNIMLEGFLARMFYISLYRLHQVAVYGKWRTGLIMVKDLLERTTRPRLKLH
ncbi:NAD(P)/FAD-dependent oxidoreductase [Kistimonas asteriae]|uniref:NAD(P)/FAD-dependent oxidoreductase n=1 Tax=Kistimonas asteriae TaxID=517724 RepID=UPI001BA6DB94|nr:NAD(P)/FAD-dependent oxidoreductase [Kistimonas asteriae]